MRSVSLRDPLSRSGKTVVARAVSVSLHFVSQPLVVHVCFALHFAFGGIAICLDPSYWVVRLL